MFREQYDIYKSVVRADVEKSKDDKPGCSLEVEEDPTLKKLDDLLDVDSDDFWIEHVGSDSGEDQIFDDEETEDWGFDSD